MPLDYIGPRADTTEPFTPVGDCKLCGSPVLGRLSRFDECRRDAERRLLTFRLVCYQCSARIAYTGVIGPDTGEPNPEIECPVDNGTIAPV